MKPLLNIRSVPISIEHKTTRAALRISAKQPAVNITRERGGLDIQRTMPQIKMDSYEMRASMGLKTTPRVIRENADTGKQDAHETASEYNQEGKTFQNSLTNKASGSPVADIAMSNSIKSYETALTYIPSVRTEMWLEGGDLSMNYTMDKLNFDWDVSSRPQLEYVPGNIEFNVTQYPEVVIEYVGGPIYAPPSADPDYVPPPSADVNA